MSGIVQSSQVKILRRYAKKLETELAESKAYADRLVELLPCLPKDIEVLRAANTEMAERVHAAEAARDKAESEREEFYEWSVHYRRKMDEAEAERDAIAKHHDACCTCDESAADIIAAMQKAAGDPDHIRAATEKGVAT